MKFLGRYAGPVANTCLVIGIVLLLAGAGYWLVERDFNLTLRIILALGILGFAGWVGFRPESPAAARGSSRRSLVYGGNAVVMSVAFLAIVGFGNYYSQQNPQRWDLTADKQNTLAEESVRVVRAIREPVKVTSFFQTDDFQRAQTVRDLMKNYQSAQPLIAYDNVDPDLNPVAFQASGARLLGSIVFEVGAKREIITNSTEQDISTAFLKLSANRSARVLFLTGHGERAIDGFDRDSMSSARQLLQQQNFSVDPINFSTMITPAAQLATEIDLLVIASPRLEFSEPELQSLNDYLDNGGKLFLMADPVEQPTKSVLAILARYQLSQPGGWLLDPGNFLRQDPAAILITNYENTPPTEPLRQQNYPTVFPGAAAIQSITNPTGARQRPLIQTSARAWLDNNPREPNPDGKTPSTYTIGYLYEPNDATSANPRGRAVIIGDSDFATNQLVNAGNIANRDFFGNLVSWATQSEELISIRPKPSASRQLFLAGQQQNLIFFSSAVFLPVGVLLIGGLVWWRRR